MVMNYLKDSIKSPHINVAHIEMVDLVCVVCPCMANVIAMSLTNFVARH